MKEWSAAFWIPTTRSICLLFRRSVKNSALWPWGGGFRRGISTRFQRKLSFFVVVLLCRLALYSLVFICSLAFFCSIVPICSLLVMGILLQVNHTICSTEIEDTIHVRQCCPWSTRQLRFIEQRADDCGTRDLLVGTVWQMGISGRGMR
jgi:fatty acid desaturase